jgi:hypothetical protein
VASSLLPIAAAAATATVSVDGSIPETVTARWVQSRMLLTTFLAFATKHSLLIHFLLFLSLFISSFPFQALRGRR